MARVSGRFRVFVLGPVFSLFLIHLSAHSALASLFKPGLTQIQSLNFDFDDNVFITPTEIMLQDLEKNKEVGISTRSWALMKLQYPGQGFKLNPDGLRYFGDTSEFGAELFPTTIRKALKTANWKGPVWDDFVQAVQNKNSRHYVSIITARLHSRHSIYRGLEVLADARDEKGERILTALPEEDRIYPVGWPDLEKEFIDPEHPDDMAIRKAKVMISLLNEVNAVDVPKDATPIVDRDGGKQKARLHTWIFSDDDYNNIWVAYEKLAPLVKNWPRVKIVLFFTGTNNPVRKPHSFVIKSDGTARPTTEEER